MAVWSEVLLSELGNGRRLDAEYYDPDLLRFEQEIESSNSTIKPLGQLVHDGYRVVYENTMIYTPDEAPADAVRFLQAADLSGTLPIVNEANVGWVQRADWDRYPKGRINHGEILVEVKGKAEKVAIVPSDFPTETLVTGTLFKFQVDESQVSPYFLLAYLLSKYGRGFRSRCLTNTLIGFVSKQELYQIPVPLLNAKLRNEIAELIKSSLACERRSHESYAEAEASLESTLRLGDLELAPHLFYERCYSDVKEAGRFDAEYFQPPKKAVSDALARMPGSTVGEQYSSVRQLWQLEKTEPGEYVRNYDLNDALQPFLDETVEPTTPDTIGSTKKRFEAGDLVVSRLRSYLREIAVVLHTGDVPMVGSSEFIVLRPEAEAIRVEALLVYLRSRFVQTVLKWCQDGSNHPRFDQKELLNLPLPDVVRDNQEEIAAKVKESIKARREALRLLEEAKTMVERAILGG